MTHSPDCAWEDFDHLPCKIVPKILQFDGSDEDKLTICEVVFLQVAAICGVPIEEMQGWLVELLAVYRGPYPDHLVEEILNRVENLNE